VRAVPQIAWATLLRVARSPRRRWCVIGGVINVEPVRRGFIRARHRGTPVGAIGSPRPRQFVAGLVDRHLGRNATADRFSASVNLTANGRSGLCQWIIVASWDRKLCF
jgi:hypothetical protein